jgi:integrase
MATALLDDVDIVSISKRLGHSNVSTTANIYLHSNAERDEKASEAIEAQLSTAFGKIADA